MALSRKSLSIGQYLLDQLHRRGVEHVFGIPGDYVLGFYECIGRSEVRHVGTTREDAAGFAADAYARIKGIGAAVVTYGVGGLSIANPVAGAYAEKSPVVVISGAPGLRERRRDPLLHHKVRGFDTQKRIYEQITVASAALEDSLLAYHEIDRVLAAVERYRRPGYIELPRDMVDVAHPHTPRAGGLDDITDKGALADCVAEAVEVLNGSRRVVVLAGVEVHRFGLQDALVELVERAGYPVAATLLGKSVINEEHPLYLGIYEGAMGRPSIRQFVERADCILMLGCMMTDIDLGVFTARLDPGKVIYASSEQVSVHRHNYAEVPFRSFLKGLLKARFRRRASPAMPPRQSPWGRPPRGNHPVTVAGLFSTLNEFITHDMIVISDVGDSCFGAADLTIRGRTEFLSPAYYTSMGFAVPAAVGTQFADCRLRPVVLVGDGAFQMTGMELSTAVRFGLTPIVIVLNNRGYGTERQIKDGPFNDINLWDFAAVPKVVGGGRGFAVRTMDDLRSALAAVKDVRDTFSILDVELGQYDISPALQRLGRSLGRNVNGGR
ncbi:MAG: alpha-keto acid decarboxylase family protein [Phycisphaerae bacterium]